MNQEQCICAAIQLPNGEVWRGHRHHNAIYAASQAGADPRGRIDGFITSLNRFVDRREGMKIQRAAGIQSVDPHSPPTATELFSEDLYLRDWRSPERAGVA